MLLEAGRVAHCVATEIERGRAARPPRLEIDPLLATRFEFRRGFGLRVLEPRDRIEVLVLSGLGARTIVRILEDRSPRELGVRRLVIQPQTEPARLRRWLFGNGYTIVEERMARERGRFYVVVAAEPSVRAARPEHPLLARKDLEQAGPCLVRSDDPLVRDYWREALRADERVLRRGFDGPGKARLLRRLELARRVLAARPAVSDRGRD